MFHIKVDRFMIKLVRTLGKYQQPITRMCCCCYLSPLERAIESFRGSRGLKVMRLEIWAGFAKGGKHPSPANNSRVLLNFGIIKHYSFGEPMAN